MDKEKNACYTAPEKNKSNGNGALRRRSDFRSGAAGLFVFFDLSQDCIPTGIYGTAFAPKAQMQPAKQAYLSSKFYFT